MYSANSDSKENRATGERKGLGHAFVWAFRDENQDGEPTGMMTFLPGSNPAEAGGNG